ncbi:hypothetical protein [Paenibacillus sp. JCM 10914]
MASLLSVLVFVIAVGAALASVDTTCGLNVLGSLDNTKVNRSRYALVYILSCTIGGAITGLAIGVIHYVLALIPIDPYQNYLIITGLALFLLLEIIHRTGLLPSGNFVVPSEWIYNSGYRSAALWGSILGLGFITLQAGVLFHAYLLLALFISPWWLSVLAGAVFGLVRASVYSFPFFRRVVYRMLDERIYNVTLLTAIRQAVTKLLILGAIVWMISYS